MRISGAFPGLEENVLRIAADVDVERIDWRRLQPLWSLEIGKPVPKRIRAPIAPGGRAVLATFEAVMDDGGEVLKGAHGGFQEGRGGRCVEWWPAILAGPGTHVVRELRGNEPRYLVEY